MSKIIITALIVFVLVYGALSYFDRSATPHLDAPVDVPVETLSVFWLQGEELVSVKRSTSTAEETLSSLLEGPNEEEIALGYTTAINTDVEIISLSIEDNVAYADFSARLGEGVAGSALVTAIRQQIESTLQQFADTVVISIEGETEEILQP